MFKSNVAYKAVSKKGGEGFCMLYMHTKAQKTGISYIVHLQWHSSHSR